MRNKTIIKCSVLFFIAMSVLVFGYSLGFFTDFIPIRGPYRELYDVLQDFNRTVFNYSVMAIVPVTLLYIFDNHRTNQYTIINKVLGLIAGGFALYQSLFVLSQIEKFREAYLAIDPVEVQIYYPKYTMSETAFDAAYLIFGGLIIGAIALIIISLVNKKTKEADGRT